MSRLKVWLFAGLVVGLILLYYSSNTRPAKAAGLKAEKDRNPAPEFALKDADGKVLRLSDYRGKVVLLDFWATWCGPCKIEIPWFMDFERRYKDRGFAVVGVSMDEEGWPAVKPFIQELAINYRIVLGDDATSRNYGGVDALPTTFIIDREGKIAAVHIGVVSKRDIQDGIEKLLGPPQANASAAGGALPAFFMRSGSAGAR